MESGTLKNNSVVHHLVRFLCPVMADFLKMRERAANLTAGPPVHAELSLQGGHERASSRTAVIILGEMIPLPAGV